MQVTGGAKGHLKACHFPVVDGEQLAREAARTQRAVAPATAG